MAHEIRLPNLGQTSDEMTILEWHKNEGDTVELAEELLCVETDKAQVDVESAEEGVLLKIVAQPGQRLRCGALLAYVGSPGEGAPTEQAPTEETATAAEPVAEPPAGESPARAKASPVVRKLAADLGIDLTTVPGSGPGGLIERRDVEQAHATRTDGDTSESAAGWQDVDVTSIRRAIARRLTRSAQTVPQFSLDAHLDARAAQRAIAEHRASGTAVTYTHLLLRVVARALREHPTMRRLWVDDGPRYRVLGKPDVGLAVAGDDSLRVITIPVPDATPLPDLVEVVNAAAKRGRAGNLEDADQRPAAISISSLGTYQVDSFRAIVDPDQTAILAVGSVQERVVAINGGMAVAPRLTVSLSCDHRAVDGVAAAQFLQTMRTCFETDPTGGDA